MEDAKVEVKVQGDHHESQLSIDTRTRQVEGGTIYNFGNNSRAELELHAGGVEGSFSHVGDSHALSLHLDKDGRFSGSYRDNAGKALELKIEAGRINIIKGSLPKNGSLSLTGEHHSLELKLDAQGRPSGEICSKLTKNGSFDLKVDGGSVSGALRHAGETHETNVELSKDGWAGSVSLTKGSKSIRIEVSGGKSAPLSSAQVSAAMNF